MKISTVIVAAASLFIVLTPVWAQNSMQFPKDGNGLLEYCSAAVSAADSPSSQLGPEFSRNMAKQGWCAGHLQAMRDMIIFWQVQVVKAVMVVNGDPNPGTEKMLSLMKNSADMTCIPDDVTLMQMSRVLVKWLRDHPERLHERANFLTIDAFQNAFPCKSAAESPKPQR